MEERKLKVISEPSPFEPLQEHAQVTPPASPIERQRTKWQELESQTGDGWHDKFVSESLARLDEIESAIESGATEEIRELTNGELERIVNTILQYGVKESHYSAIKSVLNVSQYSPINLRNVNLSHREEADYFRKFVASEIRRERQSGSAVTPAGADLFSLIEDYVRRNGPKSYKQLELLFDVVKRELDPIESRALIAVTKYLEAKKIS